MRTVTLIAGTALALGRDAHAAPCNFNAALKCDNATSTCDNLKQNGAANGCYVLTPPISATPIVIDGQDTGGTEWTGVAGLVTKTPVGSLAGSHTVRVRHESTTLGGVVDDKLVLFVTVDDSSNDPDDDVKIVFDPLHNDHVPTANATDDDVMFKIFRGADNAPGQAHAPRRITSVGDAEWTPTATHGALSVVSSGAGWAFELRVDPLELLTSQLPSAVGYGVQIDDFIGGGAAVWPLNFLAPNVITTPFANLAVLKNRQPIDYILSLDYSGSMTALDGLAENRWKRSVHAADMFVAVAGLFRDPDYFDDRVGGSRYAWSCGDDTAAGDTSAQFPAAGALSDFPASGTNLFAPSIAPDPPGGNCTPIRRGLELALSQFAASTQASDRERFVVLLSDGFHNMPSTDAGFVPPAATVATFFSAPQLTTHKVRTVSMGPDATAGTALLAAIAAAFNSTGLFEAKYNQLDPAQNLLDAYLETLQQPLHVNRVDDAAPVTTDGSFAPGTVDRLVFIGAWNVPASAKALTIERDGVAVAGTTIGPDTTIGFSALVVDHPQAGGTWKFSGPVADRPNHRYALADLRIYAEFFTEPRIYNTGDPILLQVRLREAGKPLLGADVTVETAIPGQGLGNFLATTDLECQVRPPSFPNLGSTRVVGLAREPSAGSPPAAASPATPAATRPAAAAAPPRAPDPRPGRYALAQQLLERCKKTDDKNQLPGTALFDDATHGDLIAGDGIYSLAFATTLEGSYNFRFHARAKEASGIAVSRMSLLSQYVQVAPTPEGTATTIQPGPVVNRLQTAVVMFIPKDSLGNFVGPGFAPTYRVSVPGGVTMGSLVDLGRGVYGQQFGYPVNTPTPTVIIESSDPHVKIVVGRKPPGGGLVAWVHEHCCRVLLAAVAALLLLVLLLWRRRH
ncbi:MAG TPA: choice-of-anchor X domain-containing protein [Kofleriaceae bacterium]|nr:choice-of-anchor X domain-containing protein [Kofleriaceae bacterium]